MRTIDTSSLLRSKGQRWLISPCSALLCCYSRLLLFQPGCIPRPRAPYRGEQPTRGRGTSPSSSRRSVRLGASGTLASFRRSLGWVVKLGTLHYDVIRDSAYLVSYITSLTLENYLSTVDISRATSYLLGYRPAANSHTCYPYASTCSGSSQPTGIQLPSRLPKSIGVFPAGTLKSSEIVL